MTAFAELDRRDVAYCLVVNGLAYRFCDVLAPSTGLTAGKLYGNAGPSVQTPTDVVDAILDVGPIESHIDDTRPVASQSSVEVRIRARNARTAAGARVHPVETFMRVAGHHAATHAVKLLEDLPHATVADGPVDVKVREDVSALSFPRALHLGQEVLWTTGAGGTGTAIDPWKFTGCTRGADLWATQEHVVDAARGEQPWVTSDVVNWRGRRAAIYVTALNSLGAAIGWKQYWLGLIDSPPTFDGRSIVLRINPLTWVMDYKLGVGSAARSALSVAGAHRFRVGTCDRLNLTAIWEIGAMPFVVAAADDAAGTIDLNADSAAMLDRLGAPLQNTWTCLDDSGVASDWTNPTLTFSAMAAITVTADAEVTAGNRTRIHNAGSFKQSFPLLLVDPAGAADQIVAWPSRLLDVINRPQTWQTVVACWDDPSDSGRQARFGHFSLRRTDAGWALLMSMFDQAPETGGSGTAIIQRGGRSMRAGWIIGQPVDDVRGSQLQEPGAAVRFDKFQAYDTHEGRPERWEHDGPAVWFYQAGEPVIGPFDADIYTGGTQQIEITGSGAPVRMWISGTITGTHPETGEDAYWFTVVRPERQRNVVQMEGDPPLSVQVVAAANDSDPPTYLQRLLASGVGNADNGTADVMPIGTNLPEEAIDGDSFSAMAAPESLIGQDYEAVRGKSISEQTGGLILACGAQVSQVYSEALDRWRIALVHMGPADVAESVLTLTDDDLIAYEGRERVEAEIDGCTVRAYTVRMNYRRGHGTPEEIAVPTTTEANAGGNDSGAPLVIDLPGVEIASAGGRAQAAAEVVADIRTRVGTPRIRWKLAIRADKPGAAGLSHGSVITLTSAYAIGIDPTTTASATPCRVVGFKRDLEENRLDLWVRPFTGVTAGWAQSARVASVTNATTVVIEAAAFSSDDASFFAAGDKVNVFGPGDWASRALKTLQSVTGTTFVFTAAHGLSAGDLIRAADYNTVVAAQLAQAFLADDGVLGGADDSYIIG